jgi:hypothetical protein
MGAGIIGMICNFVFVEMVCYLCSSELGCMMMHQGMQAW